MSVDREQSHRLADALRAAGISARPREDCPPAEQIWAALQMVQPPADERLRVIDHTIECPVCAEAWRLAMEIDKRDSTAVLSTPGETRWVPAWAAAAAGLLIAVGALTALPWLRAPDDAGVRDPARNAIRSLLADDASLPRQEFVLRWSGGPEGTRYDLVVTTAALEVIADVRGLERQEYQVPPDRLASIAPGTRLLWRVIARTADGGTLSSPTHGVTVHP